jgi:hypothetical protein
MFVFPDYYFPYLLYFILSLPLISVTTAIMEKTKLLQAEAACGAASRYIRLGCSLLIPALIVSAGVFNNNHPRMKAVSVEIPRKSSAIKELKIVFATDFHLGRNDGRVLDRFVAEANAVHPDIILIGGDIVGGDGNPDMGELKAQFRKLRAKYGVYAVLGNHDIHQVNHCYFPWLGQDFFAESGMTLLEDNVEKIDNALYLAGRHPSRSKPIESILEAARDDLPVVLLDHYPPRLAAIGPSRVDLQLSGHTHNGQVFPLNLIVTPLEYEFAYGIKEKSNTLFAVSSGLHYAFPPLNTQGFSEILCIKALFRSDIRAPRLAGA